MKIYISALILFLFTSIGFGQSLNKQSTYLDALELSRIYINNQNNDYVDNATFKAAYEQILSKYGINSGNIGNNPFLAGYTISQKNSPVALNKDKYSSSDAEVAVASKSNWQALVINALATFMAERFKTEAMHMAIDRLFRDISTTDKVLVAAMFPSSFKEIEKLYDKGEGNYYTADLLYVRELIKSDLEQLPKMLGTNPIGIFPQLNSKKQMADIMAIGYYVMVFSKESRDLPTLITLLSQQSYQATELKQSLQLADMIATGMRDVSDETDLWVSPFRLDPADINSVNPEVRFFYGLLYEQLKDAATQLSLPRLSHYLSGSTLVQQAQKMADLIAFVKSCNETYSYLQGKDFTIKTPEDAVLQIRSTLAIFQEISKNPAYVAVFGIDPEAGETFENVIQLSELFLKKDYQRALPLLCSYWSKYLTAGSTTTYNRSIAFLSQFAAVQTPEDMERMLNGYALPIGSSSIKRFSKFNASLNGYVGATVGIETAYGTQANQDKINFGLSAPIGLALTFGGAFTTFISVIDLGSIVNVRLGNNTEYYSDLKLEHFFAPGVGGFYNFKRLPLSIGLQYSYIPNLRNIKYESEKVAINEANRSVTRFNLSVLFDIPFLTLYNSKNN